MKRLADTTQSSQAQVVREALALFAVRVLDRDDPDFAVFNTGKGPGGSVADIPEEELLKGFGE